MSAKRSDVPVVVTGPTGYVGAWCALDLLQNGYKVRGTVRSQDKFDRLLAQPAFAKYRDHFTAVIVPDLVTGDFSEAVKGAEIVIHTASPVSQDTENAEELILRPAINGTKNVVQAAINAGTVKHIVVTSGFGAACSLDDGFPFPEPAPRYYHEKDWNKATYADAVESKIPTFAYAASKKLAEQAAYELVEQSGRPIKVSSIVAPMIIGPHVHYVGRLEDLTVSLVWLWKIVSGQRAHRLPPVPLPAVADVRTVAAAHRLAFEKDDGQGRFMVYNGPLDWSMAVEIMHKKFSSRAQNLPEVKKTDRIGSHPRLFRMDTARSREALGLTYAPVEEVLKDTIERFFEIQDAQSKI
ncbi:hypothetical protein OC861_003224 [Tilletia horrida]|nr:hypothetical protein OC861_003224 [Tilletia horrida]